MIDVFDLIWAIWPYAVAAFVVAIVGAVFLVKGADQDEPVRCAPVPDSSSSRLGSPIPDSREPPPPPYEMRDVSDDLAWLAPRTPAQRDADRQASLDAFSRELVRQVRQRRRM